MIVTFKYFKNRKITCMFSTYENLQIDICTVFIDQCTKITPCIKVLQCKYLEN